MKTEFLDTIMVLLVSQTIMLCIVEQCSEMLINCFQCSVNVKECLLNAKKCSEDYQQMLSFENEFLPQCSVQRD